MSRGDSSPPRDKPLTSPISQQLAGLLGADAVLPTDSYSIDDVVPPAVVQPRDRKGVAQVMRWASQTGAKVSPYGGGILAGLGNLPDRIDVVLDLSRLNRVTDYQPADLTATVEAGIALEDMRRELAHGEKLAPLEAPFPGRATIGGILATNCSGPLRFAYGLPRDWLIGVTVVGAGGQETKSGGRVVKNVTGYDLNKLYTGSLGTLGVILEASFKLTPRAEARAGLAASFPTLKEALSAGRSLVSQVFVPQGVQVVNRASAERLNLDLPSGADGLILALAEGRPRATARRVEESASVLSDAGAANIDRLQEPDTVSLAQRVTDLGWDEQTRPFLGLKIDLPPSVLDQFLDALQPVAGTGVIADVGFGTVQIFHWVNPFAQGGQEIDGAVAEIARVRALARSLGGTVVVEHCAKPVKAAIDVWEGCAGESELQIMRRIKEKFDPAGLLNPGRFIGRI